MICGKSIFVLAHPMEIVDPNLPQIFYSFVSNRICSKGSINRIKKGAKIN